MYTDLGKRQDDEHVKDEQNNSTIAALAEDTSLSTQQQHKWIMCEQGSAAAKETSTLGYSCEKRPYMTVILILSILILIILRKSSFIKKFVSSNQAKLEVQTDEEEALMERVF